MRGFSGHKDAENEQIKIGKKPGDMFPKIKNNLNQHIYF